MTPACPLCGGGRCVPFELSTDPVSGRSYAFVRCGGCGGEFADPMENPGPEWYAKAAFYNEDACRSGAAARLRGGVFLELGLAKDARLLDVGCGAGEFLALAAGAGYSRCSGIDFSPAQVRLARENSGLEDISVASLEEFLPGRDGSFDLVSAFEVLEHQPAPADFVKRLKGLLAPGGLLMLSVPNAARPLLFGGREAWDYPPHHLTRWDAGRLDRFLAGLGLEKVGLKDSELPAEHVYNQLFGVKLDAAVKGAIAAVKRLLFGGKAAASMDEIVASGAAGAAGVLRFRLARRLPAAALKLFFRALLLPVYLPLWLSYSAAGHRGTSLVAVYRAK